MAAPRSTSLRALRILSQQHTAAPNIRRGLHITGANSAQPINSSADRTTLFSSLNLADLKRECRKRSLHADGAKPELIERLANHDMLQSRAFSIAMRRINGNAFSDQPSTRRQINTSRSQKTVNDSSTVDLVFLPSMAEIEAPPPRAGPRIPVFPDVYRSHADLDVEYTPSPMKPQIFTIADNAASAMSEVVDNHSVEIDPFTLTEAVGRSRQGEELKKQQALQGKGPIKEFWAGFLDDLLGPKQDFVRK